MHCDHPRSGEDVEKIITGVTVLWKVDVGTASSPSLADVLIHDKPSLEYIKRSGLTTFAGPSSSVSIIRFSINSTSQQRISISSTHTSNSFPQQLWRSFMTTGISGLVYSSGMSGVTMTQDVLGQRAIRRFGTQITMFVKIFPCFTGYSRPSSSGIIFR